MNTQQQAYINGFVKRAVECGYSGQQAEAILKQADMRGMLDSMKKGFGNLKSRFMGGYPEPIGPNQPADSMGYGQAIGPVRPPSSEGYDYPIGPTQPDNFRGEMSSGANIPSTGLVNQGTNLTGGNQPKMSPPAALMSGIANNSSVQAGLQGAKKTWDANKPQSALREALKGNFNPDTYEGNPLMNMLPLPVRLPARGLMAGVSGGYAAGEDILDKAVNRNPRIAAGLQGYADAAQPVLDREWLTGATGSIGGNARVAGNLMKGLASIPAGAKGAYNAYNQANPRQ